MRALEIRPLPTGWSVGIPGVANPMLFQSGAAAEAAARRLGARLANHGQAVRLVVHLRDGSVGGRFVFAPAEEPAQRRAA